MEIVEVKCATCSKKLYVQERYIREKYFCTLKCMDSYLDKQPTQDLSKIGIGEQTSTKLNSPVSRNRKQLKKVVKEPEFEQNKRFIKPKILENAHEICKEITDS